jgi:hypothetical protein
MTEIVKTKEMLEVIREPEKSLFLSMPHACDVDSG